jgi:hypothetical protein
VRWVLVKDSESVVAEFACVALKTWHFGTENALEATDSDPRLQLLIVFNQWVGKKGGSEFHRILHLFDSPRRIRPLLGQRSPTARLWRQCRLLHTRNHVRNDEATIRIGAPPLGRVLPQK